jgi:hypothetical protein
MFADLDQSTVFKVERAIDEWPRTVPTTLRDRFTDWARSNAVHPRDFANRVEYARARHTTLSLEWIRDAEAVPELSAKQLKKLSERNVSALLDSQEGMERLSDSLRADVVKIMAEGRSGRLPEGLSPDQVPDAVRQLPSPSFGFPNAEAYHAHKHHNELLEDERDLSDPVASYADSLRTTLRTGVLTVDRPDGSSRRLEFVRDGRVRLRAIVYVRADKTVNVSTYGRPKD